MDKMFGVGEVKVCNGGEDVVEVELPGKEDGPLVGEPADQQDNGEVKVELLGEEDAPLVSKLVELQDGGEVEVELLGEEDGPLEGEPRDLQDGGEVVCRQTHRAARRRRG